MEPELLQKIVDQRLFPGDTSAATLVETHISWVILTPEFAFKIKKPVHFDFLDFSTLHARQFYCTEELRLNQRLAADMYLGVLPVGENGIGTLPALDFAVHMKRIESHLQLDLLLKEKEVQPNMLDPLAQTLVAFHKREALLGAIVYDPEAVWTDFADLWQHQEALKKHLGAEALQVLAQQMPSLEKQLRRWDTRLLDRAKAGFWIEGHGDLHSRNIFLSSPPLAFDCIEFNRHFRVMDVLNELAFLCMDLEFHGRADLAEHFMKTYRKSYEVMPMPEDNLIFIFFKAYRANVRLKVSLLQMAQHPGPDLLRNMQQYWRLMENYLQELASDLH